ncbi:MAG: alanine racemase, partial [Planctomycetota bacterium]
MHLPRVWAEVDLDAVAHNLKICRSLLRPECRVLGVVKADAYGHGALPVSATLERNGIAMLGVGDSHEAMELREGGIAAPILVLGAVVEGEIPDLIRHRITPTIHSGERIDLFNRVAGRLKVRLPVHLLIDTGMSRLGVTPRRALEHLEAILEAPHLRLRGLGTHLASPAEDRALTGEQLGLFAEVIEAARSRGLPLPLLHAAGSMALTRYPDAHHDMVRVGGILYGLAPEPPPRGLRPALRLYTQIVYLRDHPAGTPVGYGGSYVTPRRSRIATLPVGYSDGYLHALSNRAEALVRGRRAPVVGRVTMDYVMVDVTDVPMASVGDRVTLLGRDGDEEIRAVELARRAGTIPYELPCLISRRVRRFFQVPEERSQEQDRAGAEAAE